MTAVFTDAPDARYRVWSRVGVELSNVTDAVTATRLGGLDFDVELRPSGFVDDAGWHRVPGRHAVIRVDTDQFFDFVSDEYTIVQYRDAFTFLDALGLRYVAAGTLSGGRQGFVVAQLPALDQLDPAPENESDQHEFYVIVRTSHDRSRAVEVAVMPLRLRCLNQVPLQSSLRGHGGVRQRWSVRHVGDPEERLREARRTLDRTANYVEFYARQVRQLVSVDVTREDARYILRRIFPDRPRRDELVRAVEHRFTTSPTVGFHGTGWALVNAVGEHLEWGRVDGTRTAQSRFTSALQGDVLRYVGRAAQLVNNRR